MPRETHRILDAKYQKINLSKIISDGKHLSNDKHSMLYDALTKYELLFDGTLVTCKMKPLDILQQLRVKPYH